MLAAVHFHIQRLRETDAVELSADLPPLSSHCASGSRSIVMCTTCISCSLRAAGAAVSASCRSDRRVARNAVCGRTCRPVGSLLARFYRFAAAGAECAVGQSPQLVEHRLLPQACPVIKTSNCCCIRFMPSASCQRQSFSRIRSIGATASRPLNSALAEQTDRFSSDDPRRTGRKAGNQAAGAA